MKTTSPETAETRALRAIFVTKLVAPIGGIRFTEGFDDEGTTGVAKRSDTLQTNGIGMTEDDPSATVTR